MVSIGIASKFDEVNETKFTNGAQEMQSTSKKREFQLRNVDSEEWERGNILFFSIETISFIQLLHNKPEKNATQHKCITNIELTGNKFT